MVASAWTLPFRFMRRQIVSPLLLIPEMHLARTCLQTLLNMTLAQEYNIHS
jgi:hypothetical protein